MKLRRLPVLSYAKAHDHGRPINNVVSYQSKIRGSADLITVGESKVSECLHWSAFIAVIIILVLT